MLESVPRQAKVVSRVQDQVNFSNWKKVMWYCILHKLDILHSMFSSLPFWLGHEYGISLKPSVEFMTSKFAKCRNKRTLCRMACYCAIGWCDIASGQLFSDCIHMVHPIGCSFTVVPGTLAFWHGLVFRHSPDCMLDILNHLIPCSVSWFSATHLLGSSTGEQQAAGDIQRRSAWSGTIWTAGAGEAWEPAACAGRLAQQPCIRHAQCLTFGRRSSSVMRNCRWCFH